MKFIRSRKSQFFLVLMALMAMPLTVFAQETPEPPPDVGDIIVSASGIITAFNLTPYITVAAVIGVAAYLYQRFVRSSR